MHVQFLPGFNLTIRSRRLILSEKVAFNPVSLGGTGLISGHNMIISQRLLGSQEKFKAKLPAYFYDWCIAVSIVGNRTKSLWLGYFKKY